MKLRNKLLLSYLGAWSLTVFCASVGLHFGFRIYDEFRASVYRLEGLDRSLDALQFNIDKIEKRVGQGSPRRMLSPQGQNQLQEAFENLEAALVDFETSVRLQPKDYQVMYALQMRIQTLIVLYSEYRKQVNPNSRGLSRKSLALVHQIEDLVQNARRVGALRLSTERDLSEQRIDVLLWYYYLGIGLVLILALGLAVLSAKVLAGPLQRLSQAVSKVREGGLAVAVPEDSDDELGALGAAFNAMLRDLRASLISRAFVERILDSLPDAVLVQEEGILSFVNAEARGLFGLPEGVARGGSIAHFPALVPLFESPEDGTETQVQEMRVELAPGNERILLLSRASFGRAAQGMVVAAKDVTSLRTAQRELEGYQERLRSTTQLAHVGMVGAMLAHQLHQPLSSIKLFLQQMLRTMKGRSEEQRMVERLELCVHEVDRMHEKVKESLLRTRDQHSSPRVSVDCLSLVRKIVALFRSRAEEARLKIDVSSEAEACSILGSEIEVEELVYLLIQNVVQAAPRSRNASLHIRLRVLNGEALNLCFEDTCGGMSEEMRKNLFKPFASSKGIHEGIGLGMALVHQVVTKLRGTIRVDSVEGQGTTVNIDFPMS